jgi:predicted transcriptional regulator
VTDHERALLLSVRPQYAESILAGTKNAEIRRQRPGVAPGTPVIIYATKPLAAVIGTARIDCVQAGSPADLWNQYGCRMDVTEPDYANYLHDVNTAYVLLLSQARRLPAPLGLDEMRQTAAFRPPRSYRYMSQPAIRKLVNGHASGARLLELFSDWRGPYLPFP